MTQIKKKFVPVMLMPFQDDNKIDYNALDQLVEFYLEAGAGGLFANCLSSEMFHLSKEEMVESILFIVNKVNGRVPVVATGTFQNSIENQALFVKEVFSLGVESVIVITSVMAKEADSEEIFCANVEKLLQLTEGVPLGFYECPVPYKRVLSSKLLGKWVETGRVKYHKDTSLDIDNVSSKIAITANADGFGLFDAYMGHAVETLRAGSAGLSCIQGNYFPELVVWLCKHVNESNKLMEVNLVQEFFSKHMDLMHDTYPMSAKYILKKRGLNIGITTRTPSKYPDAKVKTELDNLYDEFQNLMKRVVVNE